MVVKSKRRHKRKQEKAYRSKAYATKEKILERQRSVYPRFFLHPGKAPKQLLDSVRDALQRFNWDQSELIDSKSREFYRRQRSDGWENALQMYGVSDTKDVEQHSKNNTVQAWLYLLPGQQLIHQLPDSVKERYLLFHDVMLVPIENNWLVGIRSLESEKSQYGRIYSSPFRPTVDIEGRPHRVTFHRHALEQAAQRTVYDFKFTYDRLGDIFTFFHECRRFESVKLRSGQTAITMWMRVPECSWEEGVANTLLPDRRRDVGWLFRYGYFPCEVEDGLVRAKTLLYPGYRQTPEYSMIQTSSLPKFQKTTLETKAREMDKTAAIGCRDIELLRFFHNSGIAQITEAAPDDYGHCYDPKIYGSLDRCKLINPS